jgi:hypothetical protein
MEIIRSVGSLCPVLMEAVAHQADRIEEFYTPATFIVEQSKFGLFTITVEINNSSVTIQELFPTIEAVLSRVQFCNDIGIKGAVEYVDKQE